MAKFENNDYRQNHDKRSVIAAIIVCVLLFIAAIGLFTYSYYGFKENRINNVEESKDKYMSDSVLEENEESELKDTEKDDN